MAKKIKNKYEVKFENFAIRVTKFAGSTTAFISAVSFIVLWAFSGPLFDYSEGWQLVVNTGTTIITFLMVFLIQRSQNKDSTAIQLKLNEIIAATSGASNILVDAEDLSSKELDILKNHYKQLSKLFEKDVKLGQSHSIEEAGKKNLAKLKTKKQL